MFRTQHGRPPTPVEAQHLAQQATLKTRQAKHSARSLDEQRTTWAAQSVDLIGSPDAVRAMVQAALSPTLGCHPPADGGGVMPAGWVETTADRMINELEERRATWQTWHVRAEAERQLRAADLIVTNPDAVVDQLVARALSVSVSLAGPTDADLGVAEPPQLRRIDGTSVYDVTGLTHYTSPRILRAEQRLLHNAALVGAPTVQTRFMDLALDEATAHHTPLDPGQAALVREMATSTRRVQVAIAPAGTGKTTAVRALATAWTDAGGSILGLAPSAAAAAVLRDALDPTSSGLVHADTLAKLTHTLDTHPVRPPATGLGLGDRPPDPRPDRRGRHGRHPHPRPGRATRPHLWCDGPAGGGRPAARRRRRWRDPPQPRPGPRRPAPGPTPPVHRPG